MSSEIKRRVENVRSKIMKFRVHEHEHEEILKRVPYGDNFANWSRKVLLGKQIQKREVPKVDPQLIREVRKVGVNLNQLARKVNTMFGVKSEDIENIFDLLQQCESDLSQILEGNRVKSDS